MTYKRAIGMAGMLLAVTLAAAVGIGCGDGETTGGQALARAETVDVTYYYLPG